MGEEEMEDVEEEDEPAEAPKQSEEIVAEAETTIVNVIQDPKKVKTADIAPPEVPVEKKEPEKELEPKRVLEAALFMSAKPLKLEELQKFSGIAAPGHVVKLLNELKAESDDRGSAVELREENDGWIFRLRNEYAKRVAPLAQEAEVSRSGMKILAYIAANDGILQSKVVDALGSTVYEYVGELLENGFLVKTKKGRSFALHVTQKFKDYFAT